MTTERRGIFTDPNGSYRSWEQIMDHAIKGEIKLDTPAVPDSLSFTQHLDRLEKITELKGETRLWQDSVERRIETTLPFFPLRPYSDIHFGAYGTDLKELKEHIHDFHDLPIYTALCGDMADMFNPVKHPEGMMGDAITPDEQLALTRKFFEEFREKILCTVQDPSHTDWARQVSGIEPQRWLVEGLRIPALKSGGLITLHINDIEYRGLLFHEIGRYKSSLNITNAGKRMLDMMDDVDFVISGHTHIGSFEKLVKRNKKPVIVQMGTFKVDDDFGTRHGLSPHPQIFFPTLLFDTARKNIEVIEDHACATRIVRLMHQPGEKPQLEKAE